MAAQTLTSEKAGPKLDPIFTKPSSDLFQSKDLLIDGSLGNRFLLDTGDAKVSSYGNWAKTFSLESKSYKEPKGGSKSPRAKSLATTGAFALANSKGGNLATHTTHAITGKVKKTMYQDLKRMFNSLDITVVRNSENRKLPPLMQPQSRAALTGAFKYTGMSRPDPADGDELERSAAENSTGFRRLLRTGQGSKYPGTENAMHFGTKTSEAVSRSQSRAHSRRLNMPTSSSSQRQGVQSPLNSAGKPPKIPKLNIPEVNPDFTESKELINPIKVQERPSPAIMKPKIENSLADFANLKQPTRTITSEGIFDDGDEIRDEMSPLSPAKPIASVSSRKLKNNLAESFAVQMFEISPRQAAKTSEAQDLDEDEYEKRKSSKSPDLSKLFAQNMPTNGFLPSPSEILDLTGVRSALSQALKKEMMVDAKRPFLETLMKPRSKEVRYYLTDVKAQFDLEETFRVSQHPNGAQQLGFNPIPTWMKASSVGSKNAKSGGKAILNTSIMGGIEGDPAQSSVKASKLYNINTSQGPYAGRSGTKPDSKLALGSLKEVQYVEIEKAKIKHLSHFHSIFRQLRANSNTKQIDDEVSDKRPFFSNRLAHLLVLSAGASPTQQPQHPLKAGAGSPVAATAQAKPLQPQTQAAAVAGAGKTVRFQTNVPTTDLTPVRWLFFELESTLVHVVHVQSLTQEYNTAYNTQSGQRKRMFVKLRPYLIECLERLQELYVLAVYTTMQRVAAEKVLEMIDPNKTLFKVVLCNEFCLRAYGVEVSYV